MVHHHTGGQAGGWRAALSPQSPCSHPCQSTRSPQAQPRCLPLLGSHQPAPVGTVQPRAGQLGLEATPSPAPWGCRDASHGQGLTALHKPSSATPLPALGWARAGTATGSEGGRAAARSTPATLLPCRMRWSGHRSLPCLCPGAQKRPESPQLDPQHGSCTQAAAAPSTSSSQCSLQASQLCRRCSPRPQSRAADACLGFVITPALLPAEQIAFVWSGAAEEGDCGDGGATSRPSPAVTCIFRSTVRRGRPGAPRCPPRAGARAAPQPAGVRAEPGVQRGVQPQPAELPWRRPAPAGNAPLHGGTGRGDTAVRGGASSPHSTPPPRGPGTRAEPQPGVGGTAPRQPPGPGSGAPQRPAPSLLPLPRFHISSEN